MGKNYYNQMRKGFTLIEVLLFFAISGLLLVGLLLSMNNNIARQRYQDSVQDLADFIKTQYQAVANPSITPWDSADLLEYRADPRCGFVPYNNAAGERIVPIRGQSRCQLYGKLIVFGERSGGSDDRANRVTTYPVIGMNGRSGDLTNEPRHDLRVSNIFIPALHMSDNYDIPFGGKAETLTAGSNLLGAAILIVRPPRSGSVNTFISLPASGNPGYSLIDPGATQLWNNLKNGNGNPVGAFFPDEMFTSSTNYAFLANRTLDICVGSNDTSAIGGRRRQIVIRGGGSNASAVEVLTDVESRCE